MGGQCDFIAHEQRERKCQCEDSRADKRQIASMQWANMLENPPMKFEKLGPQMVDLATTCSVPALRMKKIMKSLHVLKPNS